MGKRLDIGRNKLYRLIGSGELKCIRIGRSIRVSEEQLQAFLAKQER